MQLYPSTDLKMPIWNGSKFVLGAAGIGTQCARLAFSRLGRLNLPCFHAFMLRLQLHFFVDSPTDPQPR